MAKAMAYNRVAALRLVMRNARKLLQAFGPGVGGGFPGLRSTVAYPGLGYLGPLGHFLLYSTFFPSVFLFQKFLCDLRAFPLCPPCYILAMWFGGWCTSLET